MNDQLENDRDSLALGSFPSDRTQLPDTARGYRMKMAARDQSFEGLSITSRTCLFIDMAARI
jgi:hypothetical protein